MRSLINSGTAQLTVSGNSRLVELWEVRDNADSVLGRFAIYDASIEYGGETYTPVASPSATALEHVSEFAGGELDILAAFDDGGISIDELRTKLAYGGTAVRRVVDARFPQAGEFDLETFRVSSVAYDEDVFRITLQKAEAVMNGPAGYTLSRKCRWALGVNDGDVGCFATLTPISGTVTSVTEGSERGVFAASMSPSPATDDLIMGRLVWTGGNNEGVEASIQGHESSTVTLFEDMPRFVQVGDTFTAYQGCDKTTARCMDFSQINNFGGFPDIPGRDILVDLPDAPGGV